ncbi:hypothetical protein D3C86_1837110 [compost metagenome]
MLAAAGACGAAGASAATGAGAGFGSEVALLADSSADDLADAELSSVALARDARFLTTSVPC